MLRRDAQRSMPCVTAGSQSHAGFVVAQRGEINGRQDVEFVSTSSPGLEPEHNLCPCLHRATTSDAETLQ
jgi:hypothetical protein